MFFPINATSICRQMFTSVLSLSLPAGQRTLCAHRYLSGMYLHRRQQHCLLQTIDLQCNLSKGTLTMQRADLIFFFFFWFTDSWSSDATKHVLERLVWSYGDWLFNITLGHLFKIPSSPTVHDHAFWNDDLDPKKHIIFGDCHAFW